MGLLSMPSPTLVRVVRGFEISMTRDPTLLSLSLNGHTFFNLSDIIEHIQAYPVGLERVELYTDVVEQTTATII